MRENSEIRNQKSEGREKIRNPKQSKVYRTAISDLQG
jgi:hypothetical protein